MHIIQLASPLHCALAAFHTLCLAALVALRNAKPAPTFFNTWIIHPQSASSFSRNSYKFPRPHEQNQDPASNQHQSVWVLEPMEMLKWLVLIYLQVMIEIETVLPLLMTFCLIYLPNTLSSKIITQRSILVWLGCTGEDPLLWTNLSMLPCERRICITLGHLDRSGRSLHFCFTHHSAWLRLTSLSLWILWVDLLSLTIISDRDI